MVSLNENFIVIFECLSFPDMSLGPSTRDEDAGWATWAWSFVPQILPAEEDENGDGGGNASGRTSGKGQDEAVLMVGFYCSKAEVVFKVRSFTSKYMYNSLCDICSLSHRGEITQSYLIYAIFWFAVSWAQVF